MAKQIKVIKCPHCGSVHNTLIKDDHYRCDNCSTEYFLDNDDVNINISHHQADQTTSFGNIPTWIISIFIMVVIIAAIMINRYSSTPKKPYTPPTRPSIVSPPRITPNKPKKDVEPIPKEDINECRVAINQENKAIIVIQLVYRYYGTGISNDEKDSYFIKYVDLATNKTIKEQSLNLKKQKVILIKEWAFKQFDDDLIYVIHNEHTVYQIDPQALTIKDVTQSLFSHSKELTAGVATVKFVYDEYGSGFTILTNDGKKVVYYPLINTLYKSEDEAYGARKYFENIPKGRGKTKIQFAFSMPKRMEPSTDVPTELIKVEYEDYINGPKELIRNVMWWRGYDNRTRQYVNASSKYRIIYGSDAHRVISFKVLAPGRLFFDPSVFYQDQKNLFITSKINAAPTSPYNLQKLNIDTGDVIWSISSDKLIAKSIIPYGDKQFIVKNNCRTYTILDESGNIVKTLSLSK